MRPFVLAALLAAPAAATTVPRPEIGMSPPAGWRHSLQGPFSLWLPRTAQAFRLHWESGFYLSDCASGERVKIDGRLAELTRAENEDGTIRVSACFYAPSRAEKRVTVWADAIDDDAADDALAALKTIRFPKKR